MEKKKLSGGIKKGPSFKDPNTIELERNLSDRLGLKVDIETKGEEGTLSVHFKSLEQLDDLLQIFSRN